MTFTSRTVVVPACDLCGATESDQGETLQFDTEAQAIEYLTDYLDAETGAWHQRPDGQLVCWRRDRLHDWAREQDGVLQPGPDAMTVTWDDEDA